MRRTSLILILSLILLFSLTSCNFDNTKVAQKAQRDETKWNVMIYLCGSNLEELSGYATYNLEEIAQTTPNSDVNVYIMTGGVGKNSNKIGWHTVFSPVAAVNSMDLTSSTNGGHQYWKYQLSSSGKGEFVEWFPENRSMNDPSELQAFVTYCNSDSPNRKNLLCLWDHGGGLSGGLIADYTDTSSTDSTMTLSQMGLALKNSRVHFDAVLLDLCLMQSMETGLALCDSADYMIGSQDDVPGYGTAYSKWLQYLYDNPKCSALTFGKKVCDFQIEKYVAETSSVKNNNAISVIDLSKIKNLASSVDKIYKKTYDRLYKPSTVTFVNNNMNAPLSDFLSALKLAHYFSYASYGMYDISSVASAYYQNNYISEDEYNAIEENLSQAVVYNRTGSDNRHANGISMYFKADKDSYNEDIQQYLENFTDSTPYFRYFMQTKFGENQSLYTLSETDFQSYYGVTYGNTAVPYYLKLENYSKLGLIDSIYLLFMEREFGLVNESYIYSGTFVNKSQVTYYPYNLNETKIYMPALVVKNRDNTSYTNLYCTSNFDYCRDADGYYERYFIPMMTSGTNASFFTLIEIKDCKTNKVSFYVYNSSYNQYLESRYQCAVPISQVFSQTVPTKVCTVICDTGSFVYPTEQYFDLYSDSELSIGSIPASSMPDRPNYYKTFRYIIYDAFGNSFLINPDVAKFPNNTIIE